MKTWVKRRVYEDYPEPEMFGRIVVEKWVEEPVWDGKEDFDVFLSKVEEFEKSFDLEIQSIVEEKFTGLFLDSTLWVCEDYDESGFFISYEEEEKETVGQLYPYLYESEHIVGSYVEGGVIFSGLNGEKLISATVLSERLSSGVFAYTASLEWERKDGSVFGVTFKSGEKPLEYES